MEPRIIQKPEILIIGIPYFGDPSDNAFANTWERFIPLEDTIPNRVNSKEYYGLEFYTADFEKLHKWFYLVGVEVLNLVDIPIQLVAKRLPAAQYAVFSVKGGLPKLGEMFQYAYQTWLPNSKYIVAFPFDYEFYETDRFKGGHVPESELEIYIPVKLKKT